MLKDYKDAWLKKEGMFDITMESFNGIETYMLIGKYLLHELSKIIKKNDIRWYMMVS